MMEQGKPSWEGVPERGATTEKALSLGPINWWDLKKALSRRSQEFGKAPVE